MPLKNNLIKKKEYVVPDCQVHEYSYWLMTDIINGSSHRVDGEDYGPGTPPLDAKRYFGSSDIWEPTFKANIWEDDDMSDDKE